MGYPNISNPSEKLVFTDVCTSKLEYGSYHVVASVNGQSSCRDTDKQTRDEAIEFFKTITQRWAKYYPNYEAL